MGAGKCFHSLGVSRGTSTVLIIFIILVIELCYLLDLIGIARGSDTFSVNTACFSRVEIEFIMIIVYCDNIFLGLCFVFLFSFSSIIDLLLHLAKL